MQIKKDGPTIKRGEIRRNSVAYSVQKDGPLGDYLYNNAAPTFSVFNGSSDYEMLKGKNLLTPGVTMIRIVWGSSDDEFYNITEDYKLEGVTDINAHAGLEGVHKPVDILDRANEEGVYVNWELHSPNLFEVQEMQKKGE